MFDYAQSGNSASGFQFSGGGVAWENQGNPSLRQR